MRLEKNLEIKDIGPRHKKPYMLMKPKESCFIQGQKKKKETLLCIWPRLKDQFKTVSLNQTACDQDTPITGQKNKVLTAGKTKTADRQQANSMQ